jgi:hypothetical protein
MVSSAGPGRSLPPSMNQREARSARLISVT